MTRRSPAESDEYAFEPLAEGVVFARALPGGTALSNSGIVDLGGSSAVFDTALTLRAARDLRAAAISFLGRPPALSVNSHWHLDHLAGNQLFADGPIYATQRTVEIFTETKGALTSELSAEAIARDLRTLEAEARSARSPAARAIFAEVIGIHRELLAESAELVLTAPRDGFDRELALPGTRRCRLLSFGAGHTESDGLLFLPRERILFAGDLIVNDRHPNLASGDPEHWLVVLDEIDRLRPAQIVPGHGGLADQTTVAEVRGYLQAILADAARPGKVRMRTAYREWRDPDQFTTNVAFLRARARAATAR